MTGERGHRGVLEDPVGERQEVRLQGGQRLPRVGPAGQGADPHGGVTEQEAQHLAAGVPTGTGDCDGDRHMHDYTGFCMLRMRGVGRRSTRLA